MGILTSCQSISKTYHSKEIFSELSLGIEEGDRVGLIGPNGAGKSTLLKIFARLVEPDDGELITSRNLRVSYVSQDDQFEPGLSIEQVLDKAAREVDFIDHEREASVDSHLKLFQFESRREPWSNLSGGWRKRLSLACGMVKNPDLLLLDEPTNHLDIETILWLEKLLLNSRYSYVVISHDRAFLEAVSNKIIEMNPRFPQGYLSVDGAYQQFLTLKEEKIREQENLEKTLASKVRREIAWLAQGAKARETKSSHRQKEAEKLIEELAATRANNLLKPSIDAGFQSSGRKTKELVVGEGLSKSFENKVLFSDLDILITPKTRLGLVGRNGSGKTTLLKILTDDLKADEGSMKRADDLKVVWFEQNRESLEEDKKLRDVFNHDGDYVNYNGRSVHVTTWARKFAFHTEQLDLPVSYLSGGEKSRVLIANLMLEVADILILDEPTNDLDIQTLEILEDAIEEFPGAVILVTHDRMMLDTVSHQILTLSGAGDYVYCSDYDQCESVLEYWASRTKAAKKRTKDKKSKSARQKKGLTRPEMRALEELPGKIEELEAQLAEVGNQMGAPENASQFEVLEELMKKQKELQVGLDELYKRWETLEDKARHSENIN